MQGPGAEHAPSTISPLDDDPHLGAMIDGYLVFDPVRRDAHGVDYVARHPSSGLDARLKLLRPPREDDPDDPVSRILAAAHTRSALQHPHLCAVQHVGHHGERPLIRLEWVPSRPVEDLGPCAAPADAIRLVLQALDAFSYARTLGVTLDLDPSRWHLAPDGSLKLQDLDPPPEARDLPDVLPHLHTVLLHLLPEVPPNLQSLLDRLQHRDPDLTLPELTQALQSHLRASARPPAPPPEVDGKDAPAAEARDAPAAGEGRTHPRERAAKELELSARGLASAGLRDDAADVLTCLTVLLSRHAHAHTTEEGRAYWSERAHKARSYAQTLRQRPAAVPPGEVRHGGRRVYGVATLGFVGASVAVVLASTTVSGTFGPVWWAARLSLGFAALWCWSVYRREVRAPRATWRRAAAWACGWLLVSGVSVAAAGDPVAWAAQVRDGVAQWGEETRAAWGEETVAQLEDVRHQWLGTLKTHTISLAPDAETPLPDQVTFAALAFRRVPSGTATLGASSIGPGGVDKDDPHADLQHEPRRDFRMPSGALLSVTEVTQASYEAVLGENPSSEVGPDRPVHDVTYAEAEAYCEALNALAQSSAGPWRDYEFRLPTEEEWEYCCRAGTSTPIAVRSSQTNRRPFPARLPEVAWFQSHRPDVNDAGPFPVGGLKPNPWGFVDMHGNVGEWVRPSSVLPAPMPGRRPARGGSWATEYRGCRSSNRDLLDATFSSASMGFRVIAVPR